MIELIDFINREYGQNLLEIDQFLPGVNQPQKERPQMTRVGRCGMEFKFPV